MSEHTCVNCGTRACKKKDVEKYPDFCLTKKVPEEKIAELTEIYKDVDNLDGKIAKKAAEVEAKYYGEMTRVEEVIEFAKRMGYKKIGIATCLGLINESRTFAKIAEHNGLEVYSVICKVGAIDKKDIGIADETRVHNWCHESICNPILQAELLEEAGTELNVIVGLCVGHDTTFIRHTKAPVTYLIVKDRVLAHNPAGALYGINHYFKHLLD